MLRAPSSGGCSTVLRLRQAGRALSRRGPMPAAARLDIDAPKALRDGGGALADEERKLALAAKKDVAASVLALERAESKNRLKARALAFSATASG